MQPVRLPTHLGFALTMLLCVGGARGQSLPQPVPLSLMTGGPGQAQVRTLRDLRYRDIVRQGYDFSCGSAALATVLRYGYGQQVDEKAIISDMLQGSDVNSVMREGFSMLDMKHYAEHHGLRAHGFRIDVKALYDLKMPVISLMDVRGYKHFVVVKGAAAGRVLIADPALGHRVVYERDFVHDWNGIVLAIVSDGSFNQHSALVADRESNAIIHRVSALTEASAAVPLVELGLVRADMF